MPERPHPGAWRGPAKGIRVEQHVLVNSWMAPKSNGIDDNRTGAKTAVWVDEHKRPAVLQARDEETRVRGV